ncbi:MAG: TonB-dependent receptor [Pseudohongiellaceae bacterium]
MRQHLLISHLILASCLLLTNRSFAQESADATYPATYFASFAPNTVNDMLDRIPGISQALNSGGGGGPNSGASRGLGSSAQILIDGKRLAGKANEARAQLDRISASQVNYIEIIRGTSSDLDVQNSGQLVNIVLFESPSQSSITSELSGTFFEDGKVKPNGSLAFSGQKGRLDYLLSGTVRSGYQRLVSIENSVNGDFSPNEFIKLERFRDQTQYSLNANLAFALTERDRIAFNVLYNENDPPATLTRTIADFNSGTTLLSYEREDIPATSDNWEVGGDFEHRFSNGSRYKYLMIVNERNNETTRERYSASNENGPWNKNLFLNTDSRYRERIARTSYIWTPVQGQGIEIGIEGAQTIQDSALLLGVRTGAVGSPSHGGLTPVPQPNSHSTVEEVRYEPFVVHNWQISPRMTLESSLVAEFSEIEQTGDVNRARDFHFLKPKFDYRFNVSNVLQIKASLEQKVSQLSFADFSRSVNEKDDDQNTVAGNPNLEPEESVRFELGTDYRLPNDSGTFNSRVFYEEYKNKIGKIDISPSPTNLISTNGNVGKATAYGLITNGSLRLGFLNLPGALVTGGMTVQKGKFHHDPFAPKEHSFVPYDNGAYNLGLRQEFPSWRMNWGINYNNRFKAKRRGYDNDSSTTFPVPQRMTAWVEKTGWLGLTYRVEASNMFEEASCVERRRYQGYVRDGVLTELEKICSTTGLEAVFKLRGTF